MKIELKIKKKEVVIPEFKVFIKGDNYFIFAIKQKFDFLDSEKELQGDFSKIFFEENNLVLELQNKYFLFNISQNNLFENINEFDISFVFLDIDDKIIETNCKIFTTICK